MKVQVPSDLTKWYFSQCHNVFNVPLSVIRLIVHSQDNVGYEIATRCMY